MTTWESQLQDYSYKLFFCVHGTVHPYNIVLVNNQREAAFVLLGLLSLHSNIIVTRKDVLIWCKKEDHHTTLSSWTPRPQCTQIQRTYTTRKKVYILICINYMFRPTVAIIRFITDLRGSHISGWGY